MKILKILLIIFLIGFASLWIIGYREIQRLDKLPKNEQIKERLSNIKYYLPIEENGLIFFSIDYDPKENKVISNTKVLAEGMENFKNRETKENIKNDLCQDEWIYEDIEEYGIVYEDKYVNEKNEVLKVITIDSCD